MLVLLFVVSLSVSQADVKQEPDKVEWTEEDTRRLEELRKEAELIYQERKRSKKLIGKPGCPFDFGTRWNMECA